MTIASLPPEPVQPALATMIGIDVGKARLDAHADPNDRSRQFANDKCGRRALRNRALQLGAQRVALEPAGRFHRELHQCLAAAGIEVVVVNPRWARHFARSLGQEARNDSVDAAVLALHARLQVAQGSRPKARNLQELSDLVAARRNLVGCRQSLRKSAAEFCEAAASSLEPVIAECTGNILALEAKMQAPVNADEALLRRAGIIQSVPGCGFVNAASLCADLPEPGSVSARRAAALIGVAPYDCDSGSSQGRRRIRAICCTWPRPRRSAGIRI